MSTEDLQSPTDPKAANRLCSERIPDREQNRGPKELPELRRLSGPASEGHLQIYSHQGLIFSPTPCSSDSSASPQVQADQSPAKYPDSEVWRCCPMAPMLQSAPYDMGIAHTLLKRAFENQVSLRMSHPDPPGLFFPTLHGCVQRGTPPCTSYTPLAFGATGPVGEKS